MKFEWDPSKAAANLRKHGVSFEEAMTAFKDEFCATARDLDHSAAEYRLLRSVWRFMGGYSPSPTLDVAGRFASSVRA